VLESVAKESMRARCQLLPETVMVQPRWYVLYTFANHEKRVASELRARTVEHFLPLYRSVRCWKDRQVTLDLPLFPGYVFVHLALRDRLRVVAGFKRCSPGRFQRHACSTLGHRDGSNAVGTFHMLRCRAPSVPDGGRRVAHHSRSIRGALRVY